MDTEKKGIQSIELGYVILKTISSANKPLTITEISKACDMQKSQLYRYLISLCRIGFLEKSDDLRYSLGSELTLIGLRGLEKIDIRVKALPYIKKLNELLDETVSLAIWVEKEGPIFISWEESKKPINVNVRVGSPAPLTTSATGNIFAAFYPKEKTERLIQQELNTNTVPPEEFEQTLTKVKQAGYAFTQAYIPGIAAISAPIFDQKDDLVAAISVIGLSGVLDITEESYVTSELLKTAKELSNSLGYVYL
ncbi:IclR family transcriptional regulator [Halalkalibacterium ligniniphilum]|uniref:IclR family transcriptional regulator n=1 Tax=Halalkalibacterium ligniniphilum TaxID=1134413 RepID=UPI00034BCD46|nr:IclR family transcriptional regulator [Halalkalibacterium ligniniphilum]